MWVTCRRIKPLCRWLQTVQTGWVYFTQQTERLTALPNGNIGIGTAAPQQLLDVNGNIKFTGHLCSASQYRKRRYSTCMSQRCRPPEWHSPKGKYFTQQLFKQNNQYQFLKPMPRTRWRLITIPAFYLQNRPCCFITWCFKEMILIFGSDTDFDPSGLKTSWIISRILNRKLYHQKTHECCCFNVGHVSGGQFPAAKPWMCRYSLQNMAVGKCRL